MQLGRLRSLRLQDGELVKGREVSDLDQESRHYLELHIEAGCAAVLACSVLEEADTRGRGNCLLPWHKAQFPEKSVLEAATDGLEVDFRILPALGSPLPAIGP